MKHTLILSGTLLLATTFGVVAEAQSEEVVLTPAAIHYNPDAPRILNDYACVKVFNGKKSSCDPSVFEKSTDRCS